MAINHRVEELQGLYGPYTLSERVLQRIWLKQDFEVSELCTVSGKSVRVLSAGRWNLLGGPDFRDARLEIDGMLFCGDVEIHFHWRDWYLHGHQENTQFNQVVLHVLLHSGTAEPKAATTANGLQPETLVLMPYLNEDLEAYATEAALLEMERLDDLDWVIQFLQRPLAERWKLIHEQAAQRWQQKLTYARRRLGQQDWDVACHQACLEALGYARNREPMARIAAEVPLESMRTADADQLYACHEGRWKLQGMRPANHPRVRLQQYIALQQQRPDWTQQLRKALEDLPKVQGALRSKEFRKETGLLASLRNWQANIFAEQFSAGRLNTVFVDALLPLAAASGVEGLEAYWFHWPAGNLPDALRGFLKHAELTSSAQPMCNGLGQGALSLFIRQGE